MPRKISLSFLGTGGYRTANYFFPGKKKEQTYTTPLIQIAVQAYLEDHVGFGESDQHVLLLTNAAREANYLGAVKPFNDPAEHAGLAAELLRANHATQTKTIAVPAGHDRDSVIATFDRMVAEIMDGDEVYLDVTHSFRSLPMLALMLGSFIRVAKDARLKAIYYGAFEDRTPDGRTPVYDLGYLLELQEWTTAAYGYISYGFAKPLYDLAMRDSTNLLKATQGAHEGAKSVRFFFQATCALEEQLRTNRGYEISTGEVAANIARRATSFTGADDLERGPLPILIERVAAKTVGLTGCDGLNWLRAARLAYDDGLIQQACSLLREGMVTHICRAAQLQPGKANDRSLVETVLNALGNDVSEDKWTIPIGRERDYRACTSVAEASHLLKPFASLSPFRNDLMHAGYYTDEEPKDNARSSKRVRAGVRQALCAVEATFVN